MSSSCLLRRRFVRQLFQHGELLLAGSLAKGVELRVPVGEQFARISEFDDLSSVQHHDAVVVDHRPQTVGDGEDSRLPEFAVDSSDQRGPAMRNTRALTVLWFCQ